MSCNRKRVKRETEADELSDGALFVSGGDLSLCYVFDVNLLVPSELLTLFSFFGGHPFLCV